MNAPTVIPVRRVVVEPPSTYPVFDSGPGPVGRITVGGSVLHVALDRELTLTRAQGLHLASVIATAASELPR